MDHIDLSFINQVSARLDRFKVTNQHPFKANFRCPICGDSEKSSRKARGWFVEYPSFVLFNCYNCGEKHNLSRFLQIMDPALYNEYVVEKKLGDYRNEEPKEKDVSDDSFKTKPKPKFDKHPLNPIKRISRLDSDHPAKRFVNRRKIPPEQQSRLYFANKFKKYTNSLLPRKLDKKFPEQPRLIIPFLDQDGYMFGFQGRSFDPKSSLRYITIMLDEDRDKIFGLDKVDLSQRYYVTEGPIDSLFLPNAIAMAGADCQAPDGDAVFVYDNEPRGREIVKRMENDVDAGRKIVIWPKDLEEKDINDMVKAGRSPKDVLKIIEEHTYSGLRAKLELANWSKV